VATDQLLLAGGVVGFPDRIERTMEFAHTQGWISELVDYLDAA
jgi:hypothetical protein